jgi:hypothetical protein
MKDLSSRYGFIQQMCNECGKKLFGAQTVNVHTSTIPKREYYDYENPKLFGINSRFLPFISPYGSYHGTFVNKNQ